MTLPRGRLVARALSPESLGGYDLLITTLGYEQRAKHVSQRLARQTQLICAFAYSHHDNVHSYLENAAYFARHRVMHVAEADYRVAVRELVRQVQQLQPADAETGERPAVRIAVDISCMDRDRIAKTAEALLQDADEQLTVDFLYSPGLYEESLVGSEGTVLVNRAVHGLEGWSADPDAPLICLLGLGFESRLALAALETLEPAKVLALLPTGDDERYDQVVRQRNELLLSHDALDGRFEYNVLDPFGTLSILDASVSALTRQGRVVMVPLGPKTFALACILTAIARGGDVTVWRLSADDGRQPEDRKASGVIVGVSVEVLARDF